MSFFFIKHIIYKLYTLYIYIAGMSTCNKTMCKHELNNKMDVRKWMLKNHPDKNNGVQHPDHVNITDCYKN